MCGGPQWQKPKGGLGAIAVISNATTGADFLENGWIVHLGDPHLHQIAITGKEQTAQ